MYRLRDLKNGLYQIHVEKGISYEGTPLSIFSHAVRIGVLQSELIKAAQYLKERNHDYADFNNYGRLKWTKKNGEPK